MIPTLSCGQTLDITYIISYRSKSRPALIGSPFKCILRGVSRLYETFSWSPL